MQETYATKEAYDVYIAYLALSKHFTSNYDYHKYNGRIKASIDKFKTRNDTFFFYKLSKDPDWFDKLLANFIKDPKIWVRNLLDESSDEIYRNWKKRIDSLSYTFKGELKQLNDDFQSNFIVKNGQQPHLMILYLNKKISLETFTILCHITNVFSYWENNIVDKTISMDYIKLCKKYWPFLELDKKKFSEIVKNHFNL